ncbi:hypothetical protein DFH06DRAFT_1284684 [Mycena polygramma]|nr:hypothetical protein DFH06DRAFT_1284684 [Mycena polygramma]
MLNTLYQWATKDDSTPALWLYGPAGAGKSALMQTLCQRLQDADLLGGTFFFKRGHPTRGNGTGLFATLAYQLALHNPSWKPWISEKVEKYPSLVRTSIASQLRELIVKPCRSSIIPRVSQILIIDGLDECDGLTAQQQILHSIRNIFCAQSLPLRIIVASRPEPEIREGFGEHTFQGLHTAVNIEQSFHDVRHSGRTSLSYGPMIRSLVKCTAPK